MKKKKKKHNVGIVLKKFFSFLKIVKTGKIDISDKEVHDGSLSWLGTGTTTKSDRFKLVL